MKRRGRATTRRVHNKGTSGPTKWTYGLRNLLFENLSKRGSVAMLAANRLAGVTSEMNLRIPSHSGDEVHKEGIHPGFELRSKRQYRSKHRYQLPHPFLAEKNCCHPFLFKKKDATLVLQCNVECVCKFQFFSYIGNFLV